VNRRDFIASLAAVGIAGSRSIADESTADYVVVGSGAGGATVAARLVEAGYSVIVLEAGGDPQTSNGNYDVPAFHPFATEDPAMRWDFFVRHYADLAQQRRDPKFVAGEDGVWYPRAGTLGGCTAHNALIFLAPSPQDWNQIADLTGDPSWRAPAMWKYFQKIEDCRYRPLERVLAAVHLDATQHGWSGWLPTERPDVAEAIDDRQVRHTLARAVDNVLKETGAPSLRRLGSLADPNDWRNVEHDEIGARHTPLTTDGHRRVGARERLLRVAQTHKDKLRIELHALATRVVFDGDSLRAIGVEYQQGERLYGAAPGAGGAAGQVNIARARREVILAGGTFNTPQLLMLSGIGDPDVLAGQGIRTRRPLPGVGRNLQDRYEVPIVNRMAKPWKMLEDATFTVGDPRYREWSAHRRGVYSSNGTLLCVVQRSSAGKPVPDLFCFALLTDFRGYRPGYSETIRRRHDCLTWMVLKGHTNNRAGRVTLASPDPRVRPSINFHYFEEGSDASGDDLQSVVNGIRLVRRMSAQMTPELIVDEELPGAGVESDTDLKQFVRDHAWGHHASCTCAIGPESSGGVLTTDFKVHGTEGLRVVDASVFPRIPGLFIVCAVYMVAEKAADVIAADARRDGR
jgi:choline dehydrogenase